MKFAVSLVVLLSLPLLVIVTFVQLLYLESMRLRTRDLPSLKFFKDELEDKLALKTEEGAGSFSLIKHSLMIFQAVLFCAWLDTFWKAALAAWLTMIGASYA